MIRVAVQDIPVYSRAAGGVIVMRVPENETVVNFTAVEREEDEEFVNDLAAQQKEEEIASEALQGVTDKEDEASFEEEPQE